MPGLQMLELLSRVHRRLVRRLTPLFQAEGLSATEVIVLWKLGKKGSCRPSEVAGEISIPPSTLTGVFDRLVAKGLLERVPDPEDRRGLILKGTPASYDFTSRLSPAIENELQAIFNALPGEVSRRLVADLQLVHHYLDREEGNYEGS